MTTDIAKPSIVDPLWVILPNQGIAIQFHCMEPDAAARVMAESLGDE